MAYFGKAYFGKATTDSACRKKENGRGKGLF
jgi:hypothetical protein